MTGARFVDRFSSRSDAYARFRPQYPARLFAAIAERSPDRGLAWDCGTGSGQAALGLARHFERVVASDGSAAQLGNAMPHDRVSYVRGLAETRFLAGRSIQCITVAQALHWIDRPRFYEVVREVAAPGALLAVWTYGLTNVSGEIDATVREFHDMLHDTGHWSAERRLVDDLYATIDFDFDEVDFPDLEMTAEWSLEQFAGYIGTWSGVQSLRKKEGAGPFDTWLQRLASVWGAASARMVRWPLAVRAGRLP